MTVPGSDEKNLEFKVGAMILVAVVLLVTFILLLGDWSLEPQKQVTVYFQNPGGLSPGAAVKVAGRKAGKITEMTIIGQSGPVDPNTMESALVKVILEIDETIYDSLRSDVKFYVTTKGMLGDPFLEIDPGQSKARHNADEPVFGVNPPRLDLFIADTYELIRGLNGVIDRNTDNLDLLLGGSAKVVGAVDRMMTSDAGTKMEKIDSLFDNVDHLITDGRDLIKGLNQTYVKDPNIKRGIRNMTILTQTLNREINPLLAEIRQALSAVEALTNAIGPNEKAQIKSAISKVDHIAGRTDKLVSRVDKIVARMEDGEGTVGQLMADEEIYDDLKELIRDLKRHPWKLIWQE